MKFLERVEKLQKENEGYLVFVKCGIFFDVVGKDAVAIQQMTELRPVCIKENVCKCGIPVKTFARFLKQFSNEHKVALVVYDYDKVSEKYNEIIRMEGKKITETKTCEQCEECWYSRNRIIKGIDTSEEILKVCTGGDNE